MFENLLKLAGEPEKLSRLGFLIIRITLSLVLGASLYQWWFKMPLIIETISFPSVLELLFNGKLISIVLTILFADYLLFNFFASIHRLIPSFLYRKITFLFSKNKGGSLDKFIENILKKIDVIRKENEEAKATTGKRFNKFVHYFNVLKKTKFNRKEGVLILELYNTFWALFIVSLTIMKPMIGYSAVIYGSIGMIVWCLITYLGLIGIILLKELYEDDLEFIIKWMWTERLINDELFKRGIEVKNFTNRTDKRALIEASYLEKKIYVVYIDADYPNFSPNDLFKFINRFLKNNSCEKIFILTEQLKISLREQVVYFEMNDRIIHIPLDNYEDEQIGQELYQKITDSFSVTEH